MRSSLFVSLLVTSVPVLLFACGHKEEAKSPLTESPAASAMGTESTTTTGVSPTASSGVHLEEKPKQGEPGRTATDIQAIIVSRRAESRQCYDNAKKTNPLLEGQVKVRFLIDPSGKVSDTKVDPADTTLTDPTVQACLVGFINTFQFAESKKGFETKFGYPFIFTRGASIPPTK